MPWRQSSNIAASLSTQLLHQREGRGILQADWFGDLTGFCELEEVCLKIKDGILSNEEQRLSWAGMMGRFNLRISVLTIELAGLKYMYNGGFIRGYCEGPISKKLRLTSVHNEGGLDKISSAMVRGKMQNLPSLRSHILDPNTLDRM